MLGTKPTEAELHPQPLVRACKHPAASTRFTDLRTHCPPPSARLLHQCSSPAPLCGREAVSASGKWLQHVPDQQAMFLLFLDNAILQDLVLRLPGVLNMANKPSQSHPTSQQNVSGVSHSSSSVCLPAQPPGCPQCSCGAILLWQSSAAAWCTCQSPEPVHSKKHSLLQGCFTVMMHSSTPFSTQKPIS